MPRIITGHEMTFSDGIPVSMRCPSCRHKASFQAIGQDVVVARGSLRLGKRVCPSPDCRCVVFVVLDQARSLIASYPPERLDFDASRIPPAIAAALEEAITCHANECYVASAMLVRKSLELLCVDQGASGDNLKQRVKALRSVVILPEALLDAADALRLLGNDAAHIESQTYNDVGRDEVEAAIDLAKEILKSVYQYAGLLEKLSNLKK